MFLFIVKIREYSKYLHSIDQMISLPQLQNFDFQPSFHSSAAKYYRVSLSSCPTLYPNHLKINKLEKKTFSKFEFLHVNFSKFEFLHVDIHLVDYKVNSIFIPPNFIEILNQVLVLVFDASKNLILLGWI